MGYLIEYLPVKKVRGVEKRKTRVPALTALFLLLFLLLVNEFWPKGREIIGEILIPGDPSVTVAAMESFAQELKSGEEFSCAFENFCIRIMEEAELASG